MQQPNRENRLEHVADILLFTEANSEQIENRKQYLKKIWSERQYNIKIRPQTQEH